MNYMHKISGFLILVATLVLFAGCGSTGGGGNGGYNGPTHHQPSGGTGVRSGDVGGTIK